MGQQHHLDQRLHETASVFELQLVEGAFRTPRLWDVGDDGEEITLCSRCYMPIGEHFACIMGRCRSRSFLSKEISEHAVARMAYEGKPKNTCVHPECMAQVVIEALPLDK